MTNTPRAIETQAIWATGMRMANGEEGAKSGPPGKP